MAQSATHNIDVYQQRNPKASAYYKCVENHFEELERAWGYMYASSLGFWRTYVMRVIYKYLNCSDLHMGFGRSGLRRTVIIGSTILAGKILPLPCQAHLFCPSNVAPMNKT